METIKHNGIEYRIDWSPAYGWLVLQGIWVRYQGRDHKDCVRWIKEV